jgi:hypothetical protein
MSGTSSSGDQPHEDKTVAAKESLPERNEDSATEKPPGGSGTSKGTPAAAIGGGRNSGQRKQVTFAMGQNGGGGGNGGSGRAGTANVRGGRGHHHGGRYRHYHLHARRRPGTLSGDEDATVRKTLFLYSVAWDGKLMGQIGQLCKVHIFHFDRAMATSGEEATADTLEA